MNTCIYRAFDIDGRLLYVGISLWLINRLSGHRRSAAWFEHVATISIERHETRAAAMAAEAAAIISERPLHNIQHRPKIEQAAPEPHLHWSRTKILARLAVDNMMVKSHSSSGG